MANRPLNKLTQGTPPRHRPDAMRRGVMMASLLVLAACRRTSSEAAPDAVRDARSAATDSSVHHAADSAAAMAAVHDTAHAPRLSGAADSIAPYLVFTPVEQRSFVAAVRNKVWLLDVGRMDLDVRKDSARLRAFREAAQALSPVPRRAVLRLWWAQGAEDAVADSFAVYNGRIVMRVLGSAALDSAARGMAPLVAYAVRADSATAPAPTMCDLRTEPDSAVRAALSALSPVERRAQTAMRRAADSTLDAEVGMVRDSIEAVLRLERAPYERLQRRTKLAWSQLRGCFGVARRALVVGLRAGDAEWVRERLVLITPGGAVTTLRVDDGRFRAHDLLTAFDADGDGVDDLAVRGTAPRAGGTALLRVDLKQRRAERLAAGFAWEVF